MSRLSIALLLMVSLGALLSLVSGAPYLEATLPGGLPLGNVLAAVAPSSAAAAAVGISRPGTWLRRCAVLSFLMALAWLPVSIALAGNLELNFNGPSGRVWMWFTLAVFIAVLGVLAWASISRLSRRERA